MHPILLPANQPANRFYQGGSKIAAFRRNGVTDERVPEDWVGSATTLFGEPTLGLSELTDGQSVREAIGTDPVGWLGEDHVTAFGVDSMLLVKLLDAGERLPVHAHPSAAFARTHLNRRHGKAEAWYFLEGGTVFLGFRRDIRQDELQRLMSTQDTTAMLDAMHRIDVRPGDSVFVPAGLPHAIGENIFLVELQEPEDMSVLLEWKGFEIDGPSAGHLGLGFDTALKAVDTSEWSSAAIGELIVRDGQDSGTMSPHSAPFFRAERTDVVGEATFAASFGIIVALDGAGSITDAHGDTIPIAAGNTALVPHGAGDITVHGPVSILRCLPPQRESHRGLAS
jgi:mannose-6-phosphate isomerase